MREIKFRIFDKRQEGFMQYDDGHFYITPKGTVWDVNENVDITENTVLMQYTGLKDENGVEIYEGDLLEGYDPESRETIRPIMGVYWSNRGMWDCESFILGGMNERCKVVGNVHEHPHLLKGE